MKYNKSADRYEERDLRAVNGWAVLFGGIILYLGALALTIAAAVRLDAEENAANFAMLIVGIIWLAIGWFPFIGLRVIKPNEALVLTLFGKYIPFAPRLCLRAAMLLSRWSPLPTEVRRL